MTHIDELVDLVFEGNGNGEASQTNRLITLVETDRRGDQLSDRYNDALEDVHPTIFLPQGGDRVNVHPGVIQLLAKTRRQRGLKEVFDLNHSSRAHAEGKIRNDLEKLLRGSDPEIIKRLLQTRLQLIFLINATHGIRAQNLLGAMEMVQEGGGTASAFVTAHAVDHAAAIFNAADHRFVLPSSEIVTIVETITPDDEAKIMEKLVAESEANGEAVLKKLDGIDMQEMAVTKYGSDLAAEGIATLLPGVAYLHRELETSTVVKIDLSDFSDPFTRFFVFSEIQEAVERKYSVPISLFYEEGTESVVIKTFLRQTPRDEHVKNGILLFASRRLKERYPQCKTVTANGTVL